MLEFIKMFGLGILYTLLFPFIVAIFAAFLVYALFNYLVLECINLFGFFFGYTFTVETGLEKELENMKNELGEKNENRDLEYDSLKGSDEHE